MLQARLTRSAGVAALTKLFSFISLLTYSSEHTGRKHARTWSSQHDFRGHAMQFSQKLCTMCTDVHKQAAGPLGPAVH